MTRFKTLFKNFDSFAVTNSAGQILISQNTYHWPLTSLKSLTQMQQQFCNLQPGDVAVSNDVNTVSSGLNQFVLTLCFSLGQPLYLHIPMEMPKVFPLGLKIDQEYLRLPTLPIVSQGKVQADLIGNMSQHPLAPPRLKEALLERVNALMAILGVANKLSGLNIMTEAQGLLKTSKQVLTQELHQLENFETTSRMSLSTGETLEGRVRSSEEGLHVDFKGTTQAQGMFIPEHVTQSACLQAFKDFYFPKLSLDQNWLEYLSLTIPESFLNCKKITSQSLCAYYGYELVYSFVIQSFCKNTHRLRGSSPLIPSYFVIPQAHICLEIPASLGAIQESKEEPGYSPFLSWNDAVLNNLFLDQSPLRLEKFYPRVDRHGKGQADGSHGAHLELVAKEKVSVIYVTETGITQVKSNKQGPVDVSELIVNEDRKNPMTRTKAMTLEAGDRISLLSPGGGAIV